jgi:ABC-type cobalt transport system, permease component CbiQ and related transporters
MIAGYLARDTFLHRIPTGWKLIILAGISLAFPFITSIWIPAVMLCLILAVYVLCGREALMRLRTMKVLVPILLVIGAIQAITATWQDGLNSVIRLLAMILLADLVTLSSTMQSMMDALQPVLRPFARFGLRPRSLSLAVALVMRFIPYLLAAWRERDEAYRARTGKGASWRLVAPFIVETLHLADRVAETLDARGIGIRQTET